MSSPIRLLERVPSAPDAAIRDRPAPSLVVLNLVRFKEGLRDGSREKETFRRYLDRFTEMVETTGGVILYAGRPEGVLIGIGTERWNAAVVLRYDTPTALGEALSRREYIEIHRDSGLEVSRLVLISPAPSRR